MDFIDTIRGTENTRKTYISLYHNHLEPNFMARGVTLFEDAEMFLLCYQWSVDKGLSPRTIKMLLGVAKRMVKYYKAEMFDMRYLVQSYCQTQQPVTKACTSHYMEELLMKARYESQEFYVACLLGLHAGLRITEATTLRTRDVQFPWLLIGYSGTTKNKRGRKVRMTPVLWEEIKKLNAPDGKLINLSPSTINRKLRQLGDISFHSLRHTFATLALEAGTSPKLVQQALGHKSLQTTLDTYWNAVQDGMTDFGFLPGVK